RPPHYNLSTQTLVAVGALAGLSVWMGIAASWSPSPDTGLENMQRALAYTGVFGVALLAAGSGRHSRLLVWLALGTIVVLLGAGLLSRLYPDLVTSDRVAYGGFR